MNHSVLKKTPYQVGQPQPDCGIGQVSKIAAFVILSLYLPSSLAGSYYSKRDVATSAKTQVGSNLVNYLPSAQPKVIKILDYGYQHKRPKATLSLPGSYGAGQWAYSCRYDESNPLSLRADSSYGRVTNTKGAKPGELVNNAASVDWNDTKSDGLICRNFSKGFKTIITEESYGLVEHQIQFHEHKETCKGGDDGHCSLKWIHHGWKVDSSTNSVSTFETTAMPQLYDAQMFNPAECYYAEVKYLPEMQVWQHMSSGALNESTYGFICNSTTRQQNINPDSSTLGYAKVNEGASTTELFEATNKIAVSSIPQPLETLKNYTEAEAIAGTIQRNNRDSVYLVAGNEVIFEHGFIYDPVTRQNAGQDKSLVAYTSENLSYSSAKAGENPEFNLEPKVGDSKYLDPLITSGDFVPVDINRANAKRAEFQSLVANEGLITSALASDACQYYTKSIDTVNVRTPDTALFGASFDACIGVGSATTIFRPDQDQVNFDKNIVLASATAGADFASSLEVKLFGIPVQLSNLTAKAGVVADMTVHVHKDTGIVNYGFAATMDGAFDVSAKAGSLTIPLITNQGLIYHNDKYNKTLKLGNVTGQFDLIEQLGIDKNPDLGSFDFGMNAIYNTPNNPLPQLIAKMLNELATNFGHLTTDNLQAVAKSVLTQTLTQLLMDSDLARTDIGDKYTTLLNNLKDATASSEIINQALNVFELVQSQQNLTAEQLIGQLAGDMSAQAVALSLIVSAAVNGQNINLQDAFNAIEWQPIQAKYLAPRLIELNAIDQPDLAALETAAKLIEALQDSADLTQLLEMVQRYPTDFAVDLTGIDVETYANSFRDAQSQLLGYAAGNMAQWSASINLNQWSGPDLQRVQNMVSWMDTMTRDNLQLSDYKTKVFTVLAKNVTAYGADKNQRGEILRHVIDIAKLARQPHISQLPTAQERFTALLCASNNDLACQHTDKMALIVGFVSLYNELGLANIDVNNDLPTALDGLLSHIGSYGVSVPFSSNDLYWISDAVQMLQALQTLQTATTVDGQDVPAVEIDFEFDAVQKAINWLNPDQKLLEAVDSGRFAEVKGILDQAIGQLNEWRPLLNQALKVKAMFIDNPTLGKQAMLQKLLVELICSDPKLTLLAFTLASKPDDFTSLLSLDGFTNKIVNQLDTNIDFNALANIGLGDLGIKAQLPTFDPSLENQFGGLTNILTELKNLKVQYPNVDIPVIAIKLAKLYGGDVDFTNPTNAMQFLFGDLLGDMQNAATDAILGKYLGMSLNLMTKIKQQNIDLSIQIGSLLQSASDVERVVYTLAYLSQQYGSVSFPSIEALLSRIELDGALSPYKVQIKAAIGSLGLDVINVALGVINNIERLQLMLGADFSRMLNSFNALWDNFNKLHLMFSDPSKAVYGILNNLIDGFISTSFKSMSDRQCADAIPMGVSYIMIGVVPVEISYGANICAGYDSSFSVSLPDNASATLTPNIQASAYLKGAAFSAQAPITVGVTGEISIVDLGFPVSAALNVNKGTVTVKAHQQETTPHGKIYGVMKVKGSAEQLCHLLDPAELLRAADHALKEVGKHGEFAKEQLHAATSRAMAAVNGGAATMLKNFDEASGTMNTGAKTLSHNVVQVANDVNREVNAAAAAAAAAGNETITAINEGWYQAGKSLTDAWHSFLGTSGIGSWGGGWWYAPDQASPSGVVLSRHSLNSPDQQILSVSAGPGQMCDDKEFVLWRQNGEVKNAQIYPKP